MCFDGVLLFWGGFGLRVHFFRLSFSSIGLLLSGYGLSISGFGLFFASLVLLFLGFWLLFWGNWLFGVSGCFYRVLAYQFLVSGYFLRG